MANKKTPTEQFDADKTRAEAAEALKRAAELIASLNGSSDAKESNTKTAAKKPAAKSTATKKPSATSAKKPAAKSAATKKPSATATKRSAAKPATSKKQSTTTAKKTAAKPAANAVTKEQPVTEQETAAVALAQEPVAKNTEVVAETKIVQEPVKAVEKEPVAPVDEKPATEVNANIEKREPVAQPQAQQAEEKRETTTQNFESIRANKRATVLFVLSNLLLFVSSILLIAMAFDVTVDAYGDNGVSAASYGLFGYLGNSAEVKAALVGMAGDWVNVGYAVIAIFMIVSAVLPLALVVKNIIKYVVKKDKTTRRADAVITIAVLTVYLGLVNIFGANMTAGHVTALVLTLAAYLLCVMFCDRGSRPLCSVINMALGVAAVMIITGTAVYTNGDTAVYIANATTVSPEIKYAIITLIVAVIAVGALMATSMRRSHIALVISISAVIGACTLVTVIALAGGASEQIIPMSIGGGFVFGAVLMLLLAVLNILFAVVPIFKGAIRR